MSSTGNTNPGNFANRPKEEVRDIASKGGQSSTGGGFASMDSDKQREIASQGGKASGGSFEPGNHEIFRLRDQVEGAEGPGVTFYELLGIGASANQEDINKAYRSKSKLSHPDKVKQSFLAKSRKAQEKKKGGVQSPSKTEIDRAVREASERFKRLGLVTTILRGPGRERYDHFLSNGFPRWRGTGYYYARFRPGLGSVLLGLFIVGGGGAHYGALYLSWQRQREFVDRYIRHARRTAWGDELGIKGIPGVGGTSTPPTTGAEKSDSAAAGLNRRQRRLQEKESKRSKPTREVASAPSEMVSTVTGPTGEKKRVTAENGKVLIVDSLGHVFMEQENEEGEVQEYLLDVNEIPKPTIRDTVLYRLPAWVAGQTVGRVVRYARGETDEAPMESDDESDTGSDEAAPKAKAATTVDAPARRRGKKHGRGRS
ncbi:MAG: hypothetical protein M1838_003812 [Thelocarpon superellum]|nr:MAG: hypothetical protein M1838_003812 [Thelocarpon superellum]